MFLKLIPGKIYVDVLGKISENDTLEYLSALFVELVNKDSKAVYNIIAAYIKEDRKSRTETAPTKLFFKSYQTYKKTA